MVGEHSFYFQNKTKSYMIQTIDQFNQFLTELSANPWQDSKKNPFTKGIVILTQDMQLINRINSELGINLMLECTALHPVKQNTYLRSLDTDVCVATNSTGHAAVRLAKCKYIKLMPSYNKRGLYVTGIFSYNRVTIPHFWRKTSPKVVLNSVTRPIGQIKIVDSINQTISFEFTTNPNNFWI